MIPSYQLIKKLLAYGIHLFQSSVCGVCGVCVCCVLMSLHNGSHDNLPVGSRRACVMCLCVHVFPEF